MMERARDISAEIVAKDKDGNHYDLLDVAIREQLRLASKGDTAAYMAIMKTLREDSLKVEVNDVPIVIDYTDNNKNNND